MASRPSSAVARRGRSTRGRFAAPLGCWPRPGGLGHRSARARRAGAALVCGAGRRGFAPECWRFRSDSHGRFGASGHGRRVIVTAAISRSLAPAKSASVSACSNHSASSPLVNHWRRWPGLAGSRPSRRMFDGLGGQGECGLVVAGFLPPEGDGDGQSSPPSGVCRRPPGRSVRAFRACRAVRAASALPR